MSYEYRNPNDVWLQSLSMAQFANYQEVSRWANNNPAYKAIEAKQRQEALCKQEAWRNAKY